MRDKRVLALTLSMILLPAFGAPAAADKARAELSAFNEVPALARTGTGDFKAKLREKHEFIEYELSYGDLGSRALQAHIHFGNAWENGGVSAFLCTNLGNAPPMSDVPACPELGGTVEGVIEAADVIGPGGARGIQAGDLETLIDAIEAGATYVNVHTEAFPPGQIRGQIED